jgi:hypothetical protein
LDPGYIWRKMIQMIEYMTKQDIIGFNKAALISDICSTLDMVYLPSMYRMKYGEVQAIKLKLYLLIKKLTENTNATR